VHHWKSSGKFRSPGGFFSTEYFALQGIFEEALESLSHLVFLSRVGPLSVSSILNPASDRSIPLRVAVIGGGIAGLSAAHRMIELCQAESRLLILTLFESNSHLGGVFGSEQVGEYLVERGADSFITNKPAGLNLCRRLGLEDQLITTNARYRKSLILFRGRPYPTPDGFHLLAPAQLLPMLCTPLLSLSGKLRLLREPFVPRRKESGDESLASFVRRRLGNEMLERIVQPMVGGIYTSDPEQLSLQATLPRFIEMEAKYGSLLRGMRQQARVADRSESASGARYGLFASLKNGMQQLLDTLEQRIVAATHRRFSPGVTSLEKAEQGWEITAQGQRPQHFDGVILAVPAHVASGLLVDVHPGLSTALASIQSASSAIVLTGHSLADIKHPLDAFGLVIPHTERRRILATSFLSRKFAGRAPEGKVILRTFVGGAMQPEELEQSDEAMVATVLSELNSIFGIRRPPDFHLVTRYSRGMPQYTVGHLDRIAAIELQSKQLDRFQLAGNYFRGVGVPDCIQSGEQAAAALLSSLTVGASGGSGAS